MRPLRLDLSRLVWRARLATPSGIDRVEMAYARHFLEGGKRTCEFVVRAGALGARRLDSRHLKTFLDQLEEAWLEGGGSALTGSARLLAGSRATSLRDSAIAIIPSHQNWHRPGWLRQLRGSDGRLVLFLHDIIPIEYPEYARAGGAQRHRERLGHALALADGFIVNSLATRSALERLVAPATCAQAITVAPIGTAPPVLPDPDFAIPKEPYFLCLGTIEPRKNHLALLHLWRALAETEGQDAPRLVIVGRRGWENENIIDLLDRSPGLRRHVSEFNALGDRALAALMQQARALLMPSFSEGFGMPVNEALARGLPVIASNLAVFSETAGAVPDYLDPLDGIGWSRTIRDYAVLSSPLRKAQLERLKTWRPPDWDAHFAIVETMLNELEQ